MSERLRILIVAENASARFGGEAALPLHYYRVLKERGHAVRLLTHARTRAELRALHGDDPSIDYIEDNTWHVAMWRIGERLPARIAYLTSGFASRLATQLAQRRLARRIVREADIDVVHQPIPVSPREPSALHGLGAPLVIGPMNGNMAYPPGFREAGGLQAAVVAIGRVASSLLNRLLPGKLRASALLVANRRTRDALPSGSRARVVELVENGVDFGVFRAVDTASEELHRPRADPPTFVFVGRLADWKRVDLLLRAFATAAASTPMRLEVIGDGDQRARLEALARELGLATTVEGGGAGTVAFLGWQSQPACAAAIAAARGLVLPSILECGGAVVLEAMALGRAVVAVAWGGPLDYLDRSCGILIEPASETAVVAGFSDAMVRLAEDPALAAQLGQAGRHTALSDHDWEIKVDRMLDVYREAILGHKTTGLAPTLSSDR